MTTAQSRATSDHDILIELRTTQAMMLIALQELKKELTGATVDMKKELNATMVRKEEFDPIKKLAYGLTGTLFLTIVGMILSHIFKIS